METLIGHNAATLVHRGGRALLKRFSLRAVGRAISSSGWELWWIVSKWFSKDWWAYLFKGNTGWHNVLCRVGGHKAGVWWYTSSYAGPDMRCRNCMEWTDS